MATDRVPALQNVLMRLTSSAFTNGGDLPRHYTHDGADVSPPLAWTGVPRGTQSLALVVDDHWVVTDLPPESTGLREGAAPRATWEGAAPPGERHRYVFKLYALDRTLDLDLPTRPEEVDDAIQGHVLGEARLIANYDRAL